MPREQFDRLIDERIRTSRWKEEAEYAKHMLVREREEERIRNRTPAVEKAYKNYLMLLELSR
jgi:hypothetical protein